MIVKCQRSLETTENSPQMLFYNRARDWECQYPSTPEWDKRFQDWGPRFFAEVRWADAAPPEFVRLKPEQHW